jgi:tetratricopeptide (TPR) repeat protein
LLMISPKSIEALFNLGYALYKSGDYVNAQSFMMKTIKIDENYFDAYSVLAECQNKFMQTDQRNASLYVKKWFEYMTKANSIKPEDELTLFKLGISYCQRNQCEKAKPFLNKLEALPQLTDVENKALADCKKKCK